ncbi:hypothetical protein BBJ28_00000270 [Nothophytophthora sp. Chile5]|nr:hypothetical protein BBJ28_00000270 [Nothophytophthora sp. Chile5]
MESSFSRQLAPMQEDEMAQDATRKLRFSRRLSLRFRRLRHVEAAPLTHVDVFSGSLTGTSERFASALADKASQRGAVVSFQSLNEFDPQCYADPDGPYHSSTRITVFVVSTHFAGGPPPNAEAFSQWLRLASGVITPPTINPVLPEELGESGVSEPAATVQKSAVDLNSGRTIRPSSWNRVVPSTSEVPLRRPSSASYALRRNFLSHLRLSLRRGDDIPTGSGKPKSPVHGVQYAVFGVGNSMYLTYNAMCKFVDARLQALGAVRLCPVGLGDVSDDIDSAFAKWETQLLELMVNNPPGPPPSPPLSITEGGTTSIRAQRQSMPEGKSIGQLEAQAEVDEFPLTLLTSSFPSASGRRMSPRRFSAPSISIDTSQAVAPPVKFTVQDRHGRPVRLRFRCRYVDKELSFSLSTTANSCNQSSTATKSQSSPRDARHIRRPCIAVKSMTLLKSSTPTIGRRSERRRSESALREVALVRLAIQDPDMTFKTADTFGYYPPNSKEVVDAVGLRLGLDMDAIVETYFQGEAPTSVLSSVSSGHTAILTGNRRDRHLPFPSPCTVRTLLSDFLELRGISREFVRVASGFVTDRKEYELLESLTSIDGSAAFIQEFSQANSGILKLLELAPSLQMPFEVFMNIAPLLKPRLYSIASSHRKNPREFDLVVALGNPNEVHGLSVSNFRRVLARSSTIGLSQADSKNNSRTRSLPLAVLASAPDTPMLLLRGFVATSLFKTPADLSAPMIMIANGIGIAPLRALLQHRKLEEDEYTASRNLVKELAPAKSVGATEPLTRFTPSSSSRGKNLLLVGCSSKASLFFASELQKWESSGLLELHVAFSSEPGQPVQHVQDLVTAQNQQIAALMNSSSEARIFICGKVGMARSVHQVLMAPGTDSTDHWYPKASQSGRYVQGIFG